MIIDGHAYCFPSLDSSEGFQSLEGKLDAIQSEFSSHHQPVWRVRDRVPFTNDTLINPKTQEPRDVIWTRDIGRLAWEYEGEIYTKQYLPPMLNNLECTPETLVAEMDYVGIDKVILHQSPQFGVLNEYLTLAAQRFPSRLMRLIRVNEQETSDAPDGAIEEIQKQVHAAGSSGLQFFARNYLQSSNTDPWDDGKMRPFWDAVSSCNMPVYFTLINVDPDEYLEQHRTLLRWMDHYPDSKVVITHGLPWRHFLQDEDRMEFPLEIWEVFKAPQCHLQLLFPIQLGNIWEYPWSKTEPTVKECLEKVGADRLIWGTDMPMVARFCTYRQTLDQYVIHCDFLSENERADIIGGTAARVMGIE